MYIAIITTSQWNIQRSGKIDLTFHFSRLILVFNSLDHIKVIPKVEKFRKLNSDFI